MPLCTGSNINMSAILCTQHVVPEFPVCIQTLAINMAPIVATLLNLPRCINIWRRKVKQVQNIFVKNSDYYYNMPFPQKTVIFTVPRCILWTKCYCRKPSRSYISHLLHFYIWFGVLGCFLFLFFMSGYLPLFSTMEFSI